ncbi:hypothetical protein [Gluconacetobacter entanii]|uniref:hypothetical protein n=1 Tax=Gluconacetobacter entanii TaxID=108528 RepID=UPI0011B3662C|nr:hypothetical protein [Gluconacetobacter entanii]
MRFGPVVWGFATKWPEERIFIGYDAAQNRILGQRSIWVAGGHADYMVNDARFCDGRFVIIEGSPRGVFFVNLLKSLKVSLFF